MTLLSFGSLLKKRRGSETHPGIGQQAGDDSSGKRWMSVWTT